MPGTLLIRPAVASDAAALGVLAGELGYPAASDEMPERLRALEASGNAVALVAEIDAAVVGLVTAHTFATMHSSSPVAWLTALVVSERARGSGVGRALVHRAEDWARSVAARRISVTSGAQRKDAHEFYRSLGYAQTGVRFGKPL